MLFVRGSVQPLSRLQSSCLRAAGDRPSWLVGAGPREGAAELLVTPTAGGAFVVHFVPRSVLRGVLVGRLSWHRCVGGG